jgi:hypothetical protein
LKLKPSPSPEDFKLVSANRSPITSIGVVHADMSIQRLVIPFTFQILKQLSHNVILGQDFLRSSGAIIDCANNSISLFDGSVNASLTNQRDRTTTLQLAKSVIIPPQTQAALRLLVPPRFQNKTSLLETYEPIKNQFLMVAGALIHPTNHLTACCVVNAGLKPQKLRKYTPIARISSIDLDDSYNQTLCSLDLRHPVQDSVPSVKTSLLSHEQRRECLEKLGLNFDESCLTSEQFSKLTALLFEYQEIFCSDVENLPTSTLPPYHINLTNSQPVRQKRYPLSPQHEKLLEQYADKLLKADIIEPSTSPFNSPVILIKKSSYNPAKPDNLANLRLILDYRKVNQQVADEFVPLSAQEAFHQISEAKAKYFTTLDWTSGFSQINLDESSKPITAFSTKTRHLQFKRAPQSLKSSPWCFLNAIYSLFRPELQQHMYSYMDDGLVFHEDFDQHLTFLRTIFEKLKIARLRINPKKSYFARNKVIFLGFELTADGISIDKRRFKKIQNL